MQKIAVAGAGGFIGGHLVRRLLSDGHRVVAADIKPVDEWYQLFPEATNLVLDLRLRDECAKLVEGTNWVFNLAADMGGMGFIENNKALCMLSSLINTHLLVESQRAEVERYFFASSACVYASWHQHETDFNVSLRESDAYPADPEDGYGWEKLFGERMCRHFHEDFGMEVRVARYHNVYGPHGTFSGGREKAPAAAARKVAQLVIGDSDQVEIWGDGKQLRSFTYVDDCIEGTLRLMESDFFEPLNIGSAETVSIQDLYELVFDIAGVVEPPLIYKLDAPQGVRGRSSNNELCVQVLDWEPKTALSAGLAHTYHWIYEQVARGAGC